MNILEMQRHPKAKFTIAPTINIEKNISVNVLKII